MLRELSVQNLALIEDLRVELHPGYCAWTGETGAGKTLLLQALGLLLGERGSADLIRAGADELRVAGRFELPVGPVREAIAELLNLALDGDDLLLVRRVHRQGRGSVYVNDQPVTLSAVKGLAGLLVDIHGQRDSQSLLDPAEQLRTLDAFGELGPARQAYAEAVDRLRELRAKLDDLDASRERRLRELTLVRFERDELDKAALVPGELVDLLREREKLLHARTLFDFASAACTALHDEDGSVCETLGKLARDAEHNAKHDPDLEPLAKRLEQAADEAQDLARALRDWTQTSEADPARQDEVETRVQLLKRLEAKYRKSVDELVAYRATLDAADAELNAGEGDRATLEGQLADVFREVGKLGAKLGKERRKIASAFVNRVRKELADLGMPEATLEAQFTARPLGDDPRTAEASPLGLESLEILLAANPGEPAQPLRKVASGGELSRTMLAMKTVLAGHVRVGTTMVFDEIDANVGGRLGDVLGTKLAALGREHQVICVTHLPQVACYARHHWTIRKRIQGKRTTTTISHLGEPERIEELANMLRGSSREETTLKESAAMLAAAKKKW